MSNPTSLKKILLVEYESDNLRYREKAIQNEGYNVIAVPVYWDCLRIAKTAQPDLIVFMVSLMRPYSADFARQMKQEPSLQGIPFLVLSGDPWLKEQEIALREIKADKYLSKWGSHYPLLKAIAECLQLPG